MPIDSMPAKASIPVLNWKELEFLVSRIAPKIEGSFVDRVVVPERKSFPQGYLKSEWAIRLTEKKGESFLLLSLKPRQCYFAWSSEKSPKASVSAPHSAFDLALSKHLKGIRIESLKTLPGDRVVILKFFPSAETPDLQLALILVMIPAVPEGFLVEMPTLEAGDPRCQGWKILARSKHSSPMEGEAKEAFFSPPERSPLPAKALEIRKDLIHSDGAFLGTIETELEKLAFEARAQNAKKTLAAKLKTAQDRLGHAQKSYQDAIHEPDWQKYGDLLKGVLFEKSQQAPQKSRKVLDYETGETLEIPCDPKLDLKGQLEKFYHQAKRKLRRQKEASERAETFSELKKSLLTFLDHPPLFPDWKGVQAWEQAAGILHGDVEITKRTSAHKTSWTGKTFISKDGLPIWVGKSREENLELTFKHARGNDLWLHVRGKPGAHAVIPLSSGKSAPLETLLDAAALVLQYSGGANWGVTEVDYTFRKHVKRIKNSKEVSYTHNKTLLVKPDTQRLQRLLAQVST